MRQTSDFEPQVIGITGIGEVNLDEELNLHIEH